MTQATKAAEHFPDYHQHHAALMVRTYDQDGEEAMLRLMAEQARPLDECSYIFPDRSVVKQNYPNVYEFMSSDHWEADSVKRPAQRGIHNSSPYPNESAFPKIVHPQTLATYGLMELYRQFSTDAYCAGWMGDVENDERLQQEFEEWLSKRVENNRHLGPNTPHRYQQHEEKAIGTLAQIWTKVSKTSCR